MNTTSDFTSNFWNIYIAIIVIASFIGMIWLLVSQNKVKKIPGEEADVTGHNWDGIEEYNNPLPRWWYYLFWVTIIFGVGYLAWFPGLGDFKGFGDWTSQKRYEQEMVKAREQYSPIYSQFANKNIEQIAADPTARTIGQNLFNTYCIQCHGSDAKGAKGFANLTDGDWLWGGSPEAIEETIRYGRIGIMQPYGGLDPFPEETAKDVMHYIYSLNKHEQFSNRANPDRAAKGKLIYDQICFTCHQENGEGLVGMAPNLTDDVWLWGGNERDILNTITNGHTNEMPAWEHFLVETNNNQEDASKLRILTAYVWGLGGGQPSEAEAAAQEAAAAEAEAAAAAEEDSDRVVVEGDIVKFYFATGSSHVADGAQDALAQIIAGVQEGKTAVISGYNDATGSAEVNAEVSKQRAQAVQAALTMYGVPSDKIELRKPDDTYAGVGAEARRVEVFLQ